MRHNFNNERHRGHHGAGQFTSQQFPIAGSSGREFSPIPGGGSNHNFPSSSTGNNSANFRSFSQQQVQNFCNYKPKRDFNRCLSQHLNAVPSRWTREQAERIRITRENSAPVISPPIPRISEDLWVWDMWPLQEKDGSIAVLPGGWRVLFTLSAPRSVLPNNRHDVARIAYFYSRDGLNWIQGGLVFEEGTAFGSRQWAGSAMIDNGKIHYFYTASGRRGEAQITYEQRIAYTSSGFVSDLDGVEFVNFTPHQIILEPDGVLYQTLEQSEQSESTIIYAFRDPWFFKDPATGCEYLLFEGNIAGNNSEINCGLTGELEQQASQYTGNIGIALLRNNSYTSWQLLPALLEAGCTNQQTERPHIIVSSGRYYLFTDSHRFTFAPGLTNGPGPDGLYGFVANTLRGNYQPLNSGGLVVSNPIEEPNQAYSWLVLPDFSVLSFIDTYNLQGITTDELSNLPESFQIEHFGGTLAPTLQLRVSGRTTEIVADYDFGLVMVSQTESPKCCWNGNEDGPENERCQSCECRNHNDDCGCRQNDHHKCRDYDDECGCKHNDHHKCGDYDDECSCKQNDHHKCEDYDDGCRCKHNDSKCRRCGYDDGKGNDECKYKQSDHRCSCNSSIQFPKLDPNRFVERPRCGCSNN
ncbi:glycoside hydrolase family 68 protein [Rummeliibacillus sp. TYF005]|uniref:glycoside hydrolase family 68 protein n=1 Tax=Rummeliibacillus sp. TYF005 TaxID=2058214 RepID=UPI000F52685F|nr:glycoside hydrolase family 68 protein [Rummeliibacillus sp. TYF005]RPJ93987.1 glycoside hydrolase family 68 protein [Rummeliibacillus sp. TYF005]